MDLQAASRPAAGVLFLVAVDASLNAYSSVTSSPWTMESFGGDEAKGRSARRYVLLADGSSIGLGLVGSAIAGNWWPLLGSVVVVAFMHTLYARALDKAQASGSQSWGDRGY